MSPAVKTVEGFIITSVTTETVKVMCNIDPFLSNQ
jgi:hypothetical protein